MAYIPNITEIYENISNDFKNKLDLSDNNLKKVLDALALSLSGQIKLTYLSISDVQDEIFADTANTAENGGTLERQGIIYLNRIRRPSTSGIFTVSVVGEANSSLRAGLVFKSNDDSLNPGGLYILDQENIITGANDEIEIRSLKGGTTLLLEVGDTLTITEPVLGVEKIVTISSIIEQPLAAESVEDYRAAIIRARQLEPQGGSKTDYRLWASDAQGVRFVYPYVKNGSAGVVQVFVEATSSDSTDGNGTPSAAIITSVEEVIEFDPDISIATNDRGRRPMTAILEVLPIVPNPVDVTITGLEENSIDIQEAVRSNLVNYLESIRPYVAGADLARNKSDILFSAKLQTVVTDVLGAANFFSDFTVFVNGVNQLNFSFSRENIPYLRNLIFN